ncbi:MAG: SPOR domain-containing protein [Hyphomicrobium sp.]|nr:SPOR domain-containing protein [Hyphomicrobium sp.]
MSRSQGAANGGWPGGQRPAAGEQDPHTGGRPTQRPQAPQQAPQYAPPAQQNPGYPQQGYGEPQAQAPSYTAPQQAYHYPQQGQAPQYAAPQAPAAAPINRQGLSSFESARNAPTQDFENYPRTQPPAYAQQARQAPPPQQQRPQPTHQAPPRPQGGSVADQDPIRAAGGYRQTAPQPQYAPRPPQAAPSYDQWPAPAPPSHDPYGHDLGAYLPGEAPFPANSNHPGVDPLQQGDWAISSAGYGDPAIEQQYARGYDQQHAGALEPTYNQDEAVAYEAEEPRRRSWAMRIAGAVVVAIGLGYGLAQAYKAVLGGPAPDGAMPVVASDATPAKEKPLDPGGKQFSHTDSKVLGRLGEGGASHEEGAGGLSESDAGNGSRKVTTVVVGRDGQIAPPSASAEPAPPAQEDSVSVPGLTVVDAFGSAAQAPPQRSAAAESPPQQAEEPVVVNNPPPKARVNVKSTKVIPATTASVPEDEPAAAAPAPKKQRVAAAAPTTTNDGASSATGANGYVVVLASVPASGSSRLDALRKFADMQQQYGPVLANKTPDVRESTLAGKGAYHRLLVGPPGSRSQASELCTQLKASGYKDCWVTAY